MYTFLMDQNLPVELSEDADNVADVPADADVGVDGHGDGDEDVDVDAVPQEPQV